MVQQERRRLPRYVMRLPVKLHRGDAVVSAAVLNASASGCLLQAPEPLTPGEVVELSIPELAVPPTRVIVLRSEATSTGYLSAACFDRPAANENPFDERPSGQEGGSPPRLLH